MKWIKKIYKFFKNDKDKKVETPVVVIKPVEPLPEVPTKEEVETFPNKKLDLVEDNVNNGNPSRPDWSYLAYTAKIDPTKKEAVFSLAKKQIDNWSRYQTVSRLTGVPAGVIADIHHKECSLDFNRCLHNGDRVIGNGKKTWQVPAGRGPFATWEEAAVDALKIESHKMPTGKNWQKYYSSQEWTTVNILIFHQLYNGLGHQNKGLEYTPYDWAYTNHHDETGNYVSDGKYDSRAPIKSPGTMSLMLARDAMGFN